MDKLAPTIAWLKENGFWLANGLLLLLMAAVWYLTSTGLNEAQSKNESKIKTQFNTASNILRQTPADIADSDLPPLHPNRTTKEGMEKEIEQTVNSIIAAWEHRVEVQKDLLVFPEVIGNKFEKVFAKYNPPEKFPAKYSDFKLIDPLLDLYRVKIKQHMINLCGKDGVRTNWLLDPENYEQDEEAAKNKKKFGGDDYGSGDDGQVISVEDEDASRFAVLWSPVNQELWQDKLSQFRDRDDHNKESNSPTPLQCYMLQQDLWVLEAMFQVIRELNGDSSATDTSAIKQISHIGIGREGLPPPAELHPADARFAPKADDSLEESSDQFGSYDDPGYGVSGGSGLTAGQNELRFSEDEISENPDDGYGNDGYGNDEVNGDASKQLPPFHNMYVDTNFEPISSEQVLAVVTGEELPENNLELLIAKRLPVRIGLTMDERKIPEFMAACVNSPFSFEIQQVRINRHSAEGEVIGLGGDETNIPREGNYNSDDAASDFDDVSSVETRVNYDVNVEFFGIIKVYNPVRPDLIRKAAGIEVEEQTPSDDNLDSAATRDSSSDIRIAT